MARGETLNALAIPAEDPSPAWFLRVLTNPPPDGVRADPAEGQRATTLCTFIADLTAGEAVIAVRDDHRSRSRWATWPRVTRTPSAA